MRYSGVCTTMWAVFPSASTVVLRRWAARPATNRRHFPVPSHRLGDARDADDPGHTRGALYDAAGAGAARVEVAGPTHLRAAGRSAAPRGTATPGRGHHAEGPH